MSASTVSPSTLEETIRQSGEGWLLDSFPPQEKEMERIRRTLDAVNNLAKKRLGGDAPDISETALIEEYRRNPQRVRGFFQALGGTRTTEMLLMVWRIMQGMEIRDVQVGYRRQQEFTMTVVLESPYGVEEDPYTSKNINDFTLFRHIGVLEISGRPVLDGFYALRVRGAKG
jgi:hypothetical protein